MAHVVIIGAGLGGAPCACQMRERFGAVHRVAFKKYFLRKVRSGSFTPAYELYMLKTLGIHTLKDVQS